MHSSITKLISAGLVLLGLMALAHAQSTSPQVERWKREGWKTDFSKSIIEFPSVRSGGPPRDGIPPIDDPKFITVSDAKHLTNMEPVIGLTIDGDARAYPLQVMMWHEIVNDVVGGKPVAVTYCPLCNAAIVFDATVDGKALTFGTTGKLRKSDLVMYDRASDSWWQQFSGEAIVGSHTGMELTMLPARLESFAQFSARNPDGKVLVPNNPARRNYGRNPYMGYDEAARPFLYDGSMPDGIEPMERVVVIRRGDVEPIVVSMRKVRDEPGIVLDGFKLDWQAGQTTALGSAIISRGKDVGTITVTKAESGEAVPYDVTFAFVAHAFHPEAKILQ